MKAREPRWILSPSPPLHLRGGDCKQVLVPGLRAELMCEAVVACGIPTVLELLMQARCLR